MNDIASIARALVKGTFYIGLLFLLFSAVVTISDGDATVWTRLGLICVGFSALFALIIVMTDN